jgi:hypothetical protein
VAEFGCTNGPNRFETIVEETIDGQTRRLLWKDCPSRSGSGKYWNWRDVFVPLCVSEMADCQSRHVDGTESR